MKPLGRSLAFVCRYWDEMDRLYFGEDEVEFSKLDSEKQQMLKSVAQRAEQQAKSLLETCRNIVEERIRIAGVEHHRPRIGNVWDKGARLDLGSPAARKRHACDLAVWVGRFPSDRHVTLQLCVYLKGGRPADAQLRPLFPDAWMAGEMPEYVDVRSGLALLFKVPIDVPVGSFDMDAAPIIDAFRSQVAVQLDVAKIVKLAALAESR